jgi:hypothetical protein
VAAEPYIDITDPAYWQELASYDLRDAGNLMLRGRYYLAGLKCYKAIENSLCGYYVRDNLANTLPAVVNLSDFAASVGLLERLSTAEGQLFGQLQPFKDAAQSLQAKQALEQEYDSEDIVILIARTRACLTAIYSLPNVE